MAIIGAITSFVLLGLLRGYVLSVLWGWFVAPYFNLPGLTIAEALGLSTIMLLLTWQNAKQVEYEEWWGPMMASGLTSVVALALGWIYRAFL